VRVPSSLRVKLRVAGGVSGVAIALAFAVTNAAGATLPDSRGYELVSPGDKLGKEVVAESTRTRAAAFEAPGLPAAVTFTALGGFADAQGTGIGTEYLAGRDATPGTSGWATHGITPPQEALSYLGVVSGGEPKYLGDMSRDLTKGLFFAWSPLTDAPNVAHVPNLYLREDLRRPGPGLFRLLTDAPSLLAPPDGSVDMRLFAAAATDNFQHVLFEARVNLTNDASGANPKLYKWDGTHSRLVVAGPGCPGLGAARAGRPCSAGGRGAAQLRYTDHILSSNGSRAIFTAPVSGGGGVMSTAGAASKLFQLDDLGTETPADDATVQVNASEAAVAATTQVATFQTASADGSRIFFISPEQLTDDAPTGGLYMWERQPRDEQQTVTIEASDGTFTLTAHTQPSAGSGTLTNGSTNISSVNGAFSVGQTISGAGIPTGTTIVAIPSATALTLSAPATADGDVSLVASVDATTPALPHDATADQVQSALESLSVIGAGNAMVDGGPGAAGGGTPYIVTFTQALSGVNVRQLTADGSALSGGAGASVVMSAPVHNLSLIAATALDANALVGVIGASEDGHRLYFATAGAQLTPAAPPVARSAFYYWQDADGRTGGTLSFVGEVSDGDVGTNASIVGFNTPKVARVTPDGRYLLFEVSNGSGLAPRFDQASAPCDGPNSASTGCSEVYVYRADSSTPTAPDLVCASCSPFGTVPRSSAWVNIRRGASATAPGAHLSHALSDDGRRVFFSTAEALVPEDTNGKFDGYEYDVQQGAVHLISSGTDKFDSFFLDASADGHDVYFVTRERLVGWDRDNAYDMYDARVDGGFPEPPAPPLECSGDACQGGALAPAVTPLLGSPAFHGAGNVRASLRARKKHARCKHGKVKRKVRGRTRCVRHGKSKSKKAARRHATTTRGIK
jgi:hypothetical protein